VTEAGLAMLASVLAGRPLAVQPVEEGHAPWTDGQTVFVDPRERVAALQAIAVQASLIAAGSIDSEVLRRVPRGTRVVGRYLALEGYRALAENVDLLPVALASFADSALAARTDSPESSLALAKTSDAIAEPPRSFGVIRVKKVLAASARAADTVDHSTTGHSPMREGRQELEELDDGEVADPDSGPDLFTSPVGGGGFIGKWLKRMLGSARQSDGSGGGPPGADTPTHRTNSGSRSAHAVSSTASVATENGPAPKSRGVMYPEWDVNRQCYHRDWCTVREVDARTMPAAAAEIDDAVALRRPLARLGMGLHRRRRQTQGDDIDIDAAVAAHVELVAGGVPDESVYLDSTRRRRDLSVLVLLDVSGSTAEPGTLGRTVHQQQLVAAANLVVALHDLGDRIALYAYNSQGRAAVNLVPVKRFDDHLDARTIKQLNSLAPAAYSRLGAAIRHGSAVLEEHGGTSRRLLVVLSDGLAYDHGYERDYGAADARRALTEARRRGTGAVCLTVGASTDVAALKKVFGSAAHATVGQPERLVGVIGPLFRSAIRSAEVRRRVS
jgi:nitric oxide reductase NorD protein